MHLKEFIIYNFYAINFILIINYYIKPQQATWLIVNMYVFCTSEWFEDKSYTWIY